MNSGDTCPNCDGFYVWYFQSPASRLPNDAVTWIGLCRTCRFSWADFELADVSFEHADGGPQVGLPSLVWSPETPPLPCYSPTADRGRNSWLRLLR
jgi:hypothetical protein